MRKLKEDLRWRAPDYSKLSERDFNRALADVDLGQLEGSRKSTPGPTINRADEMERLATQRNTQA